MIRDHEEIQHYLDEVCSRVRSKGSHRDIRHELESHLEELVLERESTGVERDDAILWAIDQMGNPIDVGDGLHSVHRPKTHWGLLAGVMIFVVFGILAMVAVEGSIGTGNDYMYIQFVYSKSMAVIIGMVFMAFFYFFNYQKIRSYSFGLYAVIIMGTILTLLTGVTVSGSGHFLRLPFITLDWFGITPYLLMSAAPGMIMSWKNHKWFWMLTTIAFLVIPTLLFCTFSTMSYLLLYTAGYVLLLLFMTRSWWAVGIHGIVMGLVILLGVLQRDYRLERITSFFNPDKDPQGAGYIHGVLESSIHSAGWWGHGLKGEMTQLIPYIWSDNIGTFLIYSFGWWIGIVIVISIVFFIGRLLQSNRAVREPYGRALGMGLAGMLSFQMVYSVLMSFGLVPTIGIPFPFLSYGGSHVMIEMAILGLILGIYRRKDVVGSNDELHAQRS